MIAWVGNSASTQASDRRQRGSRPVVGSSNGIKLKRSIVDTAMVVTRGFSPLLPNELPNEPSNELLAAKSGFWAT
jgi:hypothetical protein